MNEVFDSYVKNYDMSDPDINRKYKHSYRVMAFSELLSDSLGLSDKDVKLAMNIGLLHDIGRFEEDKRFNSFGLHKNFDHGDYGSEILIKENILEKMQIDKKYYDIIVKAVKNHNKYSIEENLTKKEILFCKIIRDADKLDILRSTSKDMISSFNKSAKSKDVSETVKENFYKELQMKKEKKSVHYDANKIIGTLSLIYDINYEESIKYLVKNNILDDIYNLLKDKKGFKEYFDYINKYIEKRLKNVRK